MEEKFHHLSAMEIIAVQGLLALKNDESFLSSSTCTKSKNIVADDDVDIKGLLFEKMINNVPRKRRGSKRPAISSSSSSPNRNTNSNNNNVEEKSTSSLGMTDKRGIIRKPIVIRIKLPGRSNSYNDNTTRVSVSSSESENKEEKKTVVGVSVASSEQLAADVDHSTTAKDEVSKKRKRYPPHDECDEDDAHQLAAAPRISKKKKTTSSLSVIPPIPQALENMIRSELGGVDVKLVIQKTLFATDLNYNNGRLSMPLSQIRDHDFLTPQETHNLNIPDKRTNPLAALNNLLFIDTNLHKKTVTLKRWDMNSSSSYVLVTTWNDIVKDNKLQDQTGKAIQVWSFRMAKKLCFAMVVLH